MIVLLGIFSFILGTVIGSFLNVVIYRYNTGMGINGRSQCFSCGKSLQWYELIPVFSYLFLRGKCSQCQSRISWQYPLVEFITGCVFLLLYLKYKDFLFSSVSYFAIQYIVTLSIACIFIVIFVYDIRHKIIPDGLVIALALLSLITLFISPTLSLSKPHLLDILAGPILATPFALLWLVSGGRWMGLGDAKLALPIGWLLGLAGGLSAIILSFWIGAGLGIVLLSRKRSGITMKSEIPFAPFLIVGFMVVFFLGIDVLHLNELIGFS